MAWFIVAPWQPSGGTAVAEWNNVAAGVALILLSLPHGFVERLRGAEQTTRSRRSRARCPADRTGTYRPPGGPTERRVGLAAGILLVGDGRDATILKRDPSRYW